LIRRVRECRADGVLFTRLKFCDPEAFDHPNLKKRLDEEGIPSLLIETDINSSDVGAVATRIEAFMEQIESGGAS
jgi:benzoyl-CoA reductase/2-hydroxyglutaryl-CoA dehydratase subunit BcrC/BadD/HgdB